MFSYYYDASKITVSMWDLPNPSNDHAFNPCFTKGYWIHTNDQGGGGAKWPLKWIVFMN